LQEAKLSISPDTAAKEEKAVDGLEPSSLVQQFGSVETGPKIYQNAKLRLRELGQKMGYTPVREYFFKETAHSQQFRKIDIVWKSNNGFAAAFNIKSKSWRLEHVDDLDQLSRLSIFTADKKYIVNVSKNYGTAVFIEVTDELIRTLELQARGAPTAPHKDYDVEAIGQAFKRAHEKWNRKEDDELSKSYREGLTVAQLAEKFQRPVGAIVSRLHKLRLIQPSCISNDSEITFLVKSEKHGKICLAGVDEYGRWIRPIKAGGFEERDIVMDNGKIMGLFDVVKMKFGAPFPIKHHKENVLLSPHSNITFVKKLDENERSSLLSEIANAAILKMGSRAELYDEMALNLKQSLTVAGPINIFDIQCNIIEGKTHPRIWIINPNDRKRIFYITCTDLAFCTFIASKMANPKWDDGFISSQDIAELKDRQTFFVIGLTGDSLDENYKVKDGKYAPPESSIQPRYWSLVVSVLTVPSYSGEN
jgi:hypothetical protein